jgi:hypothetical protein
MIDDAKSRGRRLTTSTAATAATTAECFFFFQGVDLSKGFDFVNRIGSNS